MVALTPNDLADAKCVLWRSRTSTFYHEHKQLNGSALPAALSPPLLAVITFAVDLDRNTISAAVHAHPTDAGSGGREGLEQTFRETAALVSGTGRLPAGWKAVVPAVPVAVPAVLSLAQCHPVLLLWDELLICEVVAKD
jgi:hypothetical protein